MQEMVRSFDTVGSLVHAWWNTGSSLLVSSDILSKEWRPERAILSSSVAGHDLTWEVHGPRLLLRAAAVECFIKAVYVSRGGSLAEGGRYKSPGGLAHDLVALAAAAGLALDDKETTLLRRLSLWIERGRYPQPAAWERDLLDSPQGKILGTGWSDASEAAFACLRSRFVAIGRDLAAIADQDT